MFQIMAHALTAATAQVPAQFPTPVSAQATTETPGTAQPASPTVTEIAAPQSPNGAKAPKPAFKPINHDEDYSSFRAVKARQPLDADQVHPAGRQHICLARRRAAPAARTAHRRALGARPAG